jgi:hypothetical protein
MGMAGNSKGRRWRATVPLRLALKDGAPTVFLLDPHSLPSYNHLFVDSQLEIMFSPCLSGENELKRNSLILTIKALTPLFLLSCGQKVRK